MLVRDRVPFGFSFPLDVPMALPSQGECTRHCAPGVVWLWSRGAIDLNALPTCLMTVDVHAVIRFDGLAGRAMAEMIWLGRQDTASTPRLGKHLKVANGNASLVGSLIMATRC
jgi:hypothetical protein